MKYIKYSLDTFSKCKDKYKVNYPINCQVLEGNMFKLGLKIARENPSKKIAILNFANNYEPVAGCNPIGDPTQEGELFRVSNIDPPQLFYPISINSKKVNLIYGKNIEFYPGTKDSYFADVLTIAAVEGPYVKLTSKGRIFAKEKQLEFTRKKLELIMHSLRHNEIDYFVTGGWGLGTFGNPAYHMSLLWKEAIEQLAVSNVIFCFFADGENTREHIRIFSKTFLV